MELNARASARVSMTAEGVRGDDGDMELDARTAGECDLLLGPSPGIRP